MRKLFMRMAERSGIEHRWSVLPPAPGGLPHNQPGGFYHGASPATSTRMQRYAEEAPELALDAIAQAARAGRARRHHPSGRGELHRLRRARASTRSSPDASASTMSSGPWSASWAATPRSRRCAPLIISSAPSPTARVLAVTVELCSLHLQQTQQLEQLLAMLQFSDGAAAALVTAEPGGFEMSHLFSAAARGFGRADPVEDRRHRLRDDPVGRGAGPDPHGAAGRRGARHPVQRLGRRTRSTAGRSMPAAARSSTRSRRGWSCRRARCSPRATSSPATATCRPRP